jgi:NADPH:quinone reductase-like Zn-dependent oxidoreductase
VARGQLRPLVDHVFRFDEFPAARTQMESNTHLGKLVVTM